MKKILLIALVLANFQSCTNHVFKQNIPTSPAATTFKEKIDSVIINKMNQYDIPGLAVGLVKNGSILYSKGYGIKSTRYGKLVTENTIFHTASISKLFTAEAIMKLVAQNKLTFDDRLVDLVPDLKYDDESVKKITIKSLLNHTSGLPDINNYHWKNNHQSDNSLRKYILGLSLKLNADPFSEYQYSNLAYDILGLVIEEVTGANFDDYLKDNILDKSDMQNSDFRFFNIPDTLKVSPHSKNHLSGNIYVRKTYPYTREHAPSSTLNASSKELSKWMIHFINTLDNPEEGNINTRMIEPTFSPNPHIGLGFQLSSIDSNKTIGHYGGDRGFRSYLLMIPEKKIGLVLLANCDYNEDFRQEIIHPIARLMLSPPMH